MTFHLTGISLWILRIVAAVILLQTLFFKFTAAEESVFIFSELGMEPWGRIGTGLFELAAALLLLYPKTTAIGALLSAGLMLGAIGAHLTKLGIEIKGDRGLLFIYALIVLLASLVLIFVYRQELLRTITSTIKKLWI